jgi:hypothetical protein
MAEKGICKIKCTFHPRKGHEIPEDEGRYSSLLSPTSGLDGVGDQQHTPAALLRGKIIGHTGLGGSQGRSWRVREILSTPRFDPQTVQPVASRYTDYATPVHKLCVYCEEKTSRHRSFASRSRLLLSTSK